MTRYEYDGDRLVRSVTVREPEFSAADRLLLLAHQANEAEPRNQYGIPIAKATDPNVKWVADRIPAHDRAVKALKKSQASYYKQYKDADPAGDLWGVREG